MKTINNNSNLDEIIFENRNKAYGAYFLRKNYKRNVVIALFITIGFLSMSVGTPFILTYMSPEVVVTADISETRVIEIYKPPVDEPVQRIELPKPPPPVSTVSGQLAFAPEPADITDQNPPDITDPDVIPGDTNSFNPDDNIYIAPDIPDFIETENKEEKPIKPFEADELPEFIGGENEMQKFIRDHAKYPPEAMEMDIEGKVYVEFVVTETGEVSNVNLIKSVDPLLDKVALRVVKLMPKWNPGKKSGNPVSVSLIIPITFTIIK